ncbi:hypothetical protein Pelo_15782 [Pelomyxa schiedti]|nr:hypothetical protein Pelo_15782 [Pelomyxa schiedti]
MSVEPPHDAATIDGDSPTPRSPPPAYGDLAEGSSLSPSLSPPPGGPPAVGSTSTPHQHHHHNNQHASNRLGGPPGAFSGRASASRSVSPRPSSPITDVAPAPAAGPTGGTALASLVVRRRTVQTPPRCAAADSASSSSSCDEHRGGDQRGGKAEGRRTEEDELASKQASTSASEPQPGGDYGCGAATHPATTSTSSSATSCASIGGNTCSTGESTSTSYVGGGDIIVKRGHSMPIIKSPLLPPNQRRATGSSDVGCDGVSASHSLLSVCEDLVIDAHTLLRRPIMGGESVIEESRSGLQQEAKPIEGTSKFVPLSHVTAPGSAYDRGGTGHRVWCHSYYLVRDVVVLHAHVLKQHQQISVVENDAKLASKGLPQKPTALPPQPPATSGPGSRPASLSKSSMISFSQMVTGGPKEGAIISGEMWLSRLDFTEKPKLSIVTEVPQLMSTGSIHTCFDCQFSEDNNYISFMFENRLEFVLTHHKEHSHLLHDLKKAHLLQVMWCNTPLVPHKHTPTPTVTALHKIKPAYLLIMTSLDISLAKIKSDLKSIQTISNTSFAASWWYPLPNQFAIFGYSAYRHQTALFNIDNPHATYTFSHPNIHMKTVKISPPERGNPLILQSRDCSYLNLYNEWYLVYLPSEMTEIVLAKDPALPQPLPQHSFTRIPLPMDFAVSGVMNFISYDNLLILFNTTTKEVIAADVQNQLNIITPSSVAALQNRVASFLHSNYFYDLRDDSLFQLQVDLNQSLYLSANFDLGIKTLLLRSSKNLIHVILNALKDVILSLLPLPIISKTFEHVTKSLSLEIQREFHKAVGEDVPANIVNTGPKSLAISEYHIVNHVFYPILENSDENRKTHLLHVILEYIRFLALFDIYLEPSLCKILVTVLLQLKKVPLLSELLEHCIIEYSREVIDVLLGEYATSDSVQMAIDLMISHKDANVYDVLLRENRAIEALRRARQHYITNENVSDTAELTRLYTLYGKALPVTVNQRTIHFAVVTELMVSAPVEVLISSTSNNTLSSFSDTLDDATDNGPHTDTHAHTSASSSTSKHMLSISEPLSIPRPPTDLEQTLSFDQPPLPPSPPLLGQE